MSLSTCNMACSVQSHSVVVWSDSEMMQQINSCALLRRHNRVSKLASSHSNQVPQLNAPATNYHHPLPRHTYTYPDYLQLIRCLWQSKRGQGRLSPTAETAVQSTLDYLVLARKWARYAVQYTWTCRDQSHRRGESSWSSEESSRLNVSQRLLPRKDHTQLF